MLCVTEPLKRRIELFAQNVPLKSGNSAILKLWTDLVEHYLLNVFNDVDLESFKSLPKLLCKKPTEDMRAEFYNNSEKIADLLVYGIYNAFSRL